MHSDHNTNPGQPPSGEALARAQAEHRKAVEFFLRLRDVSAHHHPRFTVTNIIVALNAAVFVVMVIMGADWLMPTEANMHVYIQFGANNAAATTNGEWWRLVTSMFIHYGILHIAVNMWALHQAGAFLERLQGRSVYAITYLACGIAGGFASIIWRGDQSWSAGASGAIFGVYGAILGYMLREHRGLPQAVYKPIIKSTVTFAIFNIIFGMSVPAIDNAAHMGGFVCGIVFGAVLAQSLDIHLRRARRLRTLSLAGVLIAALILAGMEFSPRYNYHAIDRIAWEKLEHASLQKIETAEKSFNAALDRFKADKDAKALAAWIDADFIPVYRDATAALSAVHFNPGQVTARRQKLLVAALDESRQNWATFSARLSEGPARGLSVYIQRNEQIIADYVQARDSLKYERIP